ncbi:MAG: hypothetical protein JO170_30410 [Verrucomicrobia bacterium]|nr:hypothetical protein [Verrucomicrobiota bacterium]
MASGDHKAVVEPIFLDINAVFIPLVLSPGSFGFTNSSDAAYNPTLPLSSSNPKPGPNQYVFWDDFHPTTRAHYIGAEFIFKAIFLRTQFHNFLSIR